MFCGLFVPLRLIWVERGLRSVGTDGCTPPTDPLSVAADAAPFSGPAHSRGRRVALRPATTITKFDRRRSSRFERWNPRDANPTPKRSTIPGKSSVAAPVDAPASTPIKDEAPAREASVRRLSASIASTSRAAAAAFVYRLLWPAQSGARSCAERAQLRPALPPGLPPGVGAPSASRPPAAALHAGASPPAALVASGGGVSSEQRRQLRCSQSFTASTFTAPQQARAPPSRPTRCSASASWSSA